ncbi:hypothetical protein Gpo141_00013795 [Globisporangium polare]
MAGRRLNGKKSGCKTTKSDAPSSTTTTPGAKSDAAATAPAPVDRAPVAITGAPAASGDKVPSAAAQSETTIGGEPEAVSGKKTYLRRQ